MQVSSRLGRPSSPVWPRQPSCWAPALPELLIQSLFPMPRPAGTSKELNEGVPPAWLPLAPLSPCSKWKMAPLPGQTPPPSVLSCTAQSTKLHTSSSGWPCSSPKTYKNTDSSLLRAGCPQPHMLRQLSESRLPCPSGKGTVCSNPFCTSLLLRKPSSICLPGSSP